jgi:predicted membrane-bound dolichyl-phosphate-mannose-protein mannosyltransferase
MWLHQLLKWQYLGLSLLVLITLILHFSIITQPSELAFDEVHYVTDARSMIEENETLRPEHPPLARAFVVSGILLFGDNPFGWRFFSVIFGTICIVFFYLICRQLGMSNEASLLATFLLSLENLTFVQASVAMLDVYSLAFMLAAFWLYLKDAYLLSGISAGLSALAKLNGSLALPAIFIHWVFSGRNNPWRFLALAIIAPVSFLVFMPIIDFALIGKAFNPFTQVIHMLTAGSSLTFADTATEIASRPWEWILRPVGFYAL